MSVCIYVSIANHFDLVLFSLVQNSCKLFTSFEHWKRSQLQVCVYPVGLKCNFCKQKSFEQLSIVTSRLHYSNIIARILLAFNPTVECRLWFVRLCSTMAFKYFVVLIWIAFMVSCLRSGIEDSVSQRLALGLSFLPLSG